MYLTSDIERCHPFSYYKNDRSDRSGNILEIRGLKENIICALVQLPFCIFSTYYSRNAL